MKILTDFKWENWSGLGVGVEVPVGFPVGWKNYAGSGERFLLMIKVWIFSDSYLHIHTLNHLALKSWNGVK